MRWACVVLGSRGCQREHPAVTITVTPVTATLPPGRKAPGIACDPKRDVVMYGGDGAGCDSAGCNDTWELTRDAP